MKTPRRPDEVGDLASAIDAAEEARSRVAEASTTTGPQESRSPRRAVLGGVSLVLMVVAGAWGWAAWSDPVEIDPQVVTSDAVLAVEMTRLEVESFAERTGRLPRDLAEVGLENVGVEYVIDDSGFELRATDGWGDVIGYRGAGAGS
jgi:hypothetical protein